MLLFKLTMKKLVLILSLGLLGVILPACIPPSSPVEIPLGTSAADRMIARARKALKRAQSRKAHGILLNFLIRFPGDRLLGLAHYYLGQIESQEGRCQSAKVHLLRAVDADRHLAQVSKLLQGICAHKQGAYRKAVKLIGPIAARLGGKKFKLQAHLTLASAHYQLGAHLKSLDDYIKAHRLAEEDSHRSAAFNRIVEIIDRRLSDLEVKSLYETMDKGDFPAEHLAIRLAKVAISGARYKHASKLLREVVSRSGNNNSTLHKARILLNQTLTTKAKRLVVGCVVPLSGPRRQIGRRILNGMMLAAGGLSSGKASNPVVLVVRDSQGDPATARSAVESLAADEKTMVIAGPVVGKAARAAAAKAEELKIPMLTLSSGTGITELGKYIFRLFPTNQRQIDSLVSHAGGRLGFKRFAILHPNNRYGRILARYFHREVRRKGGHIASTIPYSTDTTDFSSIARRLRRVRIQGLFIPDSYQRVGLIARYLAVQRIPISTLFGLGPRVKRKPIYLLGTNEWHSPKILQMAASYLEGAMFTTAFTPMGEGAPTSRFLAEFRQRYKRTPSYLEAFGYDLISLLIHLSKTRQLTSRDALRHLLVNMPVFQGVTGRIAFDATGNLKTPMQLLTIKNRAFQLIK